MTPLQLALAAWSEALVAARADARTHRTFLNIIAATLAREFARYLEEGRQ
jgi:hypothetical protein